MATKNSIYCPNCRNHTELIVRVAETAERGHPLRYEIGECNACAQRFLVYRLVQYGTINRIYPSSLPRPVDPAIPTVICVDIEEALTCLAAGAPRAAAVMARRAMQNICLEKGAPP